jgi:hypothetical protein
MSSEKNIFSESAVFLIAEFRPLYSEGDYDLGIISELSDKGFIIETQNYIDLTEGNILEINLKHPDSNMEIAVLGQIVLTKTTWYKNIIEFKFHEAEQETKSMIEELVSITRSKQKLQPEEETGSIDIALQSFDKSRVETNAKEPGLGEITVEDTTSDKNEEVMSKFDESIIDTEIPAKNETENAAHAEPFELNIEEVNEEKLPDRMPQVNNLEESVELNIEEVNDEKLPVGMSQVNNDKLQDKEERPFQRNSAYRIKITAIIICLAAATFLINNSIKQGEEFQPQKLAKTTVQQRDDEKQLQLNNINTPSDEVITLEPLKIETPLEDMKRSGTLPLQEKSEVEESIDNTQTEIEYEDTSAGEIIAGVSLKPELLKEDMGAGGTLLAQEKTEVPKALPARSDIEQNISDRLYAVFTYILNIRANPSTESSIVGKLEMGTVFASEGTVENDEGLWLKMDRGYVFGMYTIELIKQSLHFTDKEKRKYTVYADSLNIRSKPTVESPVIGKLKRGEVFVLNGTEEKDDGLWLKMDRGYVFAIYAVELHQDQ